MSDLEKISLWEEYSKNKTQGLREKIIIEYIPLVKIVAGRMSMHLGYHVEYEDLVSYGIFGLIDAIDKFDMLKEVKFETYASLRIRGAILDQIRKIDWIPRTVRQKQKKIDTALKEVMEELGNLGTDQDVALKLGIEEEEYIEWQSQVKITNIVSLNEYMEAGCELPYDKYTQKKFDEPEESLEKEELKYVLAETLKMLTEKERIVITLYYFEELTLKEISTILEVTESRVSQLHTKGLQKMKLKMGKYMGVLNI